MKKMLFVLIAATILGITLSHAQNYQPQAAIPCDSLPNCRNKLNFDTATYTQLNASFNKTEESYQYVSRKVQSLINEDNTKISAFESNNSN